MKKIEHEMRIPPLCLLIYFYITTQEKLKHQWMKDYLIMFFMSC